MHQKVGAFFICFVKFTSNLFYIIIWNQSVRNKFHCWRLLALFLQSPEYTIKLSLHQAPRLRWYLINWNCITKSQLISQIRNSLRLERSIYFSKWSNILLSSAMCQINGFYKVCWDNYLYWTIWTVVYNLQRFIAFRTTNKHMVAIGLDQSLSNNALYEHRCLENIKKLYKSYEKCDNQQKY